MMDGCDFRHDRSDWDCINRHPRRGKFKPQKAKFLQAFFLLVDQTRNKQVVLVHIKLIALPHYLEKSQEEEKSYVMWFSYLLRMKFQYRLVACVAADLRRLYCKEGGEATQKCVEFLRWTKPVFPYSLQGFGFACVAKIAFTSDVLFGITCNITPCSRGHTNTPGYCIFLSPAFNKLWFRAMAYLTGGWLLGWILHRISSLHAQVLWKQAHR